MGCEQFYKVNPIPKGFREQQGNWGLLLKARGDFGAVAPWRAGWKKSRDKKRICCGVN